MTLGNRIQKLRKESKLTQQELSKKINLSHPQLVRYETKDVQPPADILKKIASIFGVSIDYLVNGTKDQKAKDSLQDEALLSQFKKINGLSNEKKSIVMDLIDAYLFRSQIQKQLAL